MRIAVTGSTGQLALSLIERAHEGVEIVTLRRPAFALEDRRSVLDGIKMVRPDVVINAAAYTAVDKAEAEEDLAVRVNGEGAGHVAEAAARIAFRFCICRRITFSTANSIALTARTTRPGRSALTDARSWSAKSASPNAAPTAPFCARRGSTVRSGRTSCAPCCGSMKRATKSASWPISAAIRPQRSTSRTHCSSSRSGFGRDALDPGEPSPARLGVLEHRLGKVRPGRLAWAGDVEDDR